MAIPVSSSITPILANTFLQEGFELSLDAIVPSVDLTGSFIPDTSKMEFYIYDYSKTLLYENLNYSINGSHISFPPGTSTSTSTSSYNRVELSPIDDVYNQGFSNGDYFALYNFVDYELGSELQPLPSNPTTGGVNGLLETTQYDGHPYFLKDISGDRTELRIQNNFLSAAKIETLYNVFTNKLNSRNDADEFYVAFGQNKNFIAVNSQLELPTSGSTTPTSILIKLYKPLPPSYEVDQQVQIISKVAETQAYSIEFTPNLEFIDSLLSLKGPNYNIDIKDQINNSTNYKNLNDLINANSSQSYFQFNSLQDETGVYLRKNYGEYKEFIKYSSAEQRLNNFYDKMVSIEAYEAEILNLDTISSGTQLTDTFSSSYSAVNNNINDIISKFDSYEYYLYYITGSESWPKYDSTYPYPNYSVSSSVIKNWFGSTDEISAYYNSGKNQIYSASRYDNDNQDYLYYVIPPFITENSNNNQYIKFVNMVGQAFDEMYLYTEAIEQVRNTNSQLTGSVLPLQLADEVIESFGFNTYANSFNSIGFNPNTVGIIPAIGSGEEYITRYIDITSGSVINYYDQDQTTLGYIINLADPSYPYPLDNASQEIYKRIFHNMISLVKRKGTVTGLRQLINIWGVPNTMLRISEFGGKNKNDENDYDLWMNRYSTAITTYPRIMKTASLSSPTSSVRIPWQPLTGNFYATGSSPITNTNYYAVPDCIQFRFKSEEFISPTSNFSQSLLVKGDLEDGTADFAVTLAYSGSNSGSYSGAILPTTSQYGNLTFHLSGSIAEGGVISTTPISLPFFDGNWWSVQLQRLTHISASTEDNASIIYELRTANNIYEGYDGNQIGFQGIEQIGITGSSEPSYNAAWNDTHGVTTFNPSSNSYVKGYSALVLGGMMDAGANNNNIFIGTGVNSVNIGSGFSGSFQEFRYYRRALSGSQFNDYVMNPESIQGHGDANTGEGSSFDLLSFRLPLGNELEYTNITGSGTYLNFVNGQGDNMAALTFGGNSAFTGETGFGSLHPSLVNKEGTLYTSSFITTNNVTSSQYSFAYQGRNGLYDQAITSSFLAPNNEINYMDQPAAGIRNRIKNKIQVIDRNEYGTTLSPFRSIQQEFQQSSSYTEDLNSLEVGFSFQNEINDDIISTFGHGVVSDAIADPRFISESSDRYPELTRIAEDYFKKYQGYTVTDPRYTGTPTLVEQEFDYNRLIKFYESSLFKAIKNYVPARTSLSTGIIVKQHLLERNKTDAIIAMNLDTVVAITPETGSVDGIPDPLIEGGDPFAGYNSAISLRNLEITGSIPMETLTGSAGGSVNQYNNLGVNSQNFNRDLPYLHYQENNNFTITTTYQNIIIVGGNLTQLRQSHFNLLPGVGFDGFLVTDAVYNGNLVLELSYNSGTLPNTLSLELRSDLRGTIMSDSMAINAPSPQKIEVSSDKLFSIFPGEKIRLFVKVASNTVTLDYNAITIGNTNLVVLGSSDNVLFNSASQQFYRTLDDFTGETVIKDTQEEFYNGEYSGSNIPMIPDQYNPYRIFADGTNLNPDDLPGSGTTTPPSINLAATPFNVTRFPTVAATSATAVPIRATGSLVYPSGSANSDMFIFRSMGTQTNITRRVKIKSQDGTTRTYLNIGDGWSGYNTAANSKYLFLNNETNALSDYSTVTAIGPNPTTSGTETITLVSANKTIEASVSFGGGTWGNATVTDNNPLNDNATNWVEAGDNFTGVNSNGKQVNFEMTAASLTNGLLCVQCNNNGNATGASFNFKESVESTNGHNGKLSVTRWINEGIQLGWGAQIFETEIGPSTAGSIEGIAEYADDTVGVVLKNDGGVDYQFPSTFQGGANEGAADSIYLQNAITNLTPGAQYEISFDITNLSSDGLGNSNNDVGMSTLATPGGVGNGVGIGLRGTANQTLTGTWTQAAGQTTAMFFSSFGMRSQIQNVQIVFPEDTLAPKHFFSRDAFTIMPTASVLFENSIYNPIINNVTESRKNSFLFDQDFDPPTPSFIEGANPTTLGIPSDYSLLISSSQLGFRGTQTTADNLLEYAEVPDSNYTQTNVINPRYVGTEIFSADYNFYTGVPSESLAIGKSDNSGGGITGLANPPFLLTQNKIRFVNNETGSWTGDYSYGKTAVINRNPINIAHFKSSLESKEYYGTTTFNIDQLIQVPFEEILSQQSPIITSSLVNGSNENLIPMSSTFMVGREATIVYNQSNKVFNNIGGTVLTYTNLGVGAKEINAGGIDFISYFSNERSLNNLTLIQYYDFPNWYDYGQAISQSSGRASNPNIESTGGDDSSIQLSASYFGITRDPYLGDPSGNSTLMVDVVTLPPSSSSTFPGDVSFYTGNQNVLMAYTSSLKDENNRDVGILNLQGPVDQIPGIFVNSALGAIPPLNPQTIKGPVLNTFNTINNLIQLGDICPTTASNITPVHPVAAAGEPIYQQGGGTGRSILGLPLIPASNNLAYYRTPREASAVNPTFGPGSLPILDEAERQNNENYYRWNISGSNLREYRDVPNQKILIEKGDEIRVSYGYLINPLNTATLTKTYQDFTVLGYHQTPPQLFTNTKEWEDGSSGTNPFTNVTFEIASYDMVDAVAQNNPVTQGKWTTSIFTGPLPPDGYYSYASLLNKYQASMNNGDIFLLTSMENTSTPPTPRYLSGSITGISSRSVTSTGSGIIGLTMSIFNSDDAGTLGNNASWMIGTNYITNYLPSKYQGTDFENNPILLTASIQPIVVSMPATQADGVSGGIWDSGYLFDRVKVFPNPKDIKIPIPNGKIFALTLRKRQEADDRVVLNANQPSGSAGARTLSGDGYLIPNDLTNTQQRNVQKIINKLKSENVFTQDSPESLGS